MTNKTGRVELAEGKRNFFHFYPNDFGKGATEGVCDWEGIETLPANGKNGEEKGGRGDEIHAFRLLTCFVDVFKAAKKSM